MTQPHCTCRQSSCFVPHDECACGCPIAALYAAAPDLLEALLAVQQAFADGAIRYTKRRQSDADPYHPSNVKMCAAIAKATQ